MAPIKFDEHIKTKLEKRVLQPSPEAWATLSNRLDKEDKGSSRKLVWWLGIAASIIGIVLVSSPFWNDTEEQILPTVVEIEKPNTQDLEEEPNNAQINEQFPLEKKPQEHMVSKETQPNKRKGKVQDNVSQPPLKSDLLKQTQGTNAIAQEAQLPTKDEPIVPVKLLDAESIKVMEVVAEINALTDSGYQVSDEELNQLLKKAERELLTDKLYNETTKTVDANALLQDVEADLDQSFRAKVFDALKNGYDSVRTAVANRNN